MKLKRYMVYFQSDGHELMTINAESYKEAKKILFRQFSIKRLKNAIKSK